MKNIVADYGRSDCRSNERGQAVVLIVLILGMFLLGTTALAVDFTNLWFHRQAAQAAADAACTAGAHAMVNTVNDPAYSSANFTINWNSGTAFDCNSTTNTPCSYATLNGYSSSLTSAAVSSAGTTPGDNVRGSFPTSTCPNTLPLWHA